MTDWLELVKLHLLGHEVYLGVCLVAGFGFCALFCLILSSSFVFVVRFLVLRGPVGL